MTTSRGISESHLGRIVVAGFLCGMVLSLPLWVSERFYPRIPAFDGFSPLPLWWDRIFFIALAALLLSSARRPERGIFPFLVPVPLLILIFSDITRLQPWVYQYTLLLFFLLIPSRSGRKPAEAVSAARIVLSGVYFWSGAQKVNLHFVRVGFPTMIAPLAPYLPQDVFREIAAFAVFIPLIEISIGLGLLIPRTARWASLAACAMHAFILALIGPLGSATNLVVWPWNITAAILCLLAVRADAVTLKASPRAAAAFFICWCLPVLNFFGLLDTYLSGALYSETTPVVTFTFPAPVAEQFSPAVRKNLVPAADGRFSLRDFYWTLPELDVPPYPEARVAAQVHREMCARLGAESGWETHIRSRPRFSEGETLPLKCAGGLPTNLQTP